MGKDKQRVSVIRVYDKFNKFDYISMEEEFWEVLNAEKNAKYCMLIISIK
jgi:hypothetical protein